MDVEFVGGDLSKAQGGGGVTIRYDDECIIACEENPRCKYVNSNSLVLLWHKLFTLHIFILYELQETIFSYL